MMTRNNSLMRLVGRGWKDQPGWAIMSSNTRRSAFHKRGAFFDRDVAGKTQPQKFLGRELSATIANRNHDAIDVSFSTIDLSSEVRPITFGLIKLFPTSADRYRQIRPRENRHPGGPEFPGQSLRRMA